MSASGMEERGDACFICYVNSQDLVRFHVW